MANSLRVSSDLRAAEETFARARKLDDLEGSTAALREAAPLIDEVREPLLGRKEEAQAAFEQVRREFAKPVRTVG